MRAITYLFGFLVIGLIISCNGCDSTKGSKKKAAVVIDPASEVFPIEIQKGGDFESVQQIRMQALAMIDNRIKQEPEPMSMVTYGYHVPEFAFNANKMSKKGQYEGHWIDFKEDFTYEYGYYEQSKGTGKYHYRLDDGALLMVNDNDDFEPKSWTLNSNSEAIALVGQHTFEVNNGMQIKLLPADSKPSR